MSITSVYSAITEYLQANWTLTPIIFENDETEPPEGLAPWVLTEIIGDTYEQQSIGEEPRSGNSWYEDGVLFLHIFAKAGTGRAALNEIADTLIALFKGKQLAPDIEFRRMQTGAGGRADDNGNYYRISVSVEWIKR